MAYERFDRAFEPYRPETAYLDPDVIEIDPQWNVRVMDSPETLDHIKNLKASIRARGVDEPVRVSYDTATGIPKLVAGECRVTACRELKREGLAIVVPAIRAKGDETELTTLSLTENSGHPLTQWEIGLGCIRLQKLAGFSLAQVAARIGKPTRYVTEAIALAEAPVEAKRLLAAGEVTPSRLLSEIATLGPEAAVESLGGEVAKNHTRPRDGSVKSKPKPLARKKAPNPAQKVMPLADDLAHAVMAANDADWTSLQSRNLITRKAREYLKVRGLK